MDDPQKHSDLKQKQQLRRVTTFKQKSQHTTQCPAPRHEKQKKLLHAATGGWRVKLIT